VRPDTLAKEPILSRVCPRAGSSELRKVSLVFGGLPSEVDPFLGPEVKLENGRSV
jgi:hypothetical protein